MSGFQFFTTENRGCAIIYRPTRNFFCDYSELRVNQSPKATSTDHRGS